MLRSAIVICFLIASQNGAAVPIENSTSSSSREVARGGGYGHGGYGGGHSISMDPVSVLGLLSLGAVLLRSILSVLTSSARSLDVSDINLPLQLSDIPEAIANWQNQISTQHIVNERSADDELTALNTALVYETLLRTEKRCVPHFLCTLWKARAKKEDSVVDIIFLATAGLLGETDSASVYDKMKKPGVEYDIDDVYCRKAQASCLSQPYLKP